MKSHLKRIAMPKSWVLAKKKSINWIVKPKPGAHPLERGVALAVILRDMLGYAKTIREVKNILLHKKVLVDGKRRKDHRLIVGLMDVVSIPEIKENFRIILNRKGKIALIKIDEKDSKIKPCKITGKTPVKKKMQLNLFDGKNILVDKDIYKVNDTVILSLPEQKISDSLKFDKGALVYLTAGKRIGVVGTVQDIKTKTVIIKTAEEEFETAKKYCFVIGKDKSIIKLEWIYQKT